MRLFCYSFLILATQVFGLPESDIPALSDELRNLQHHAQSLQKVVPRMPIGEYMQQAKYWFQKQRWTTVIRLIENEIYSDAQDQLSRLWMLAISNQKINQYSKSREHLHQYLNIALHMEIKPKRFLEAISTLIDVSTKDRLGEEFASILSLEIPQDLKNKILLITSASALKYQKLEVAKAWLKTIIQSSPQPYDHAAAMYYLGFIAVQQKKYTKAFTIFDSVNAIQKEEALPWRDRSFLAAGLLAHDLGQFKKAQSLLQHVSPASKTHKKSLEALIETFMSTKQYASAIPVIEQLSQNSKNQHLKKMLAWSDAQTGEFSRALLSVNHIEQELEKDRMWIEQRSQSNLEIADFNQLKTILKKWMSIPKSMKIIERNIQIYTEGEKRLFSLDSRIQNIDYLMGHLGPHRIMQPDTDHIQSIIKILDESNEIGEKLILAVRTQTRAQTSPATETLLKAHAHTRHENMKPILATRIQYHTFQNLKNSIKQLINSSQVKQRIENLNAKINALKWHQSINSNQISQNIENIESSSKELSKHLLKTISTFKDVQFKKSSQTFNLSQHAHILLTNLKSIEDDWIILSQITQKDRSPMGTLRYEQTLKVHDQWGYVSGLILRSFHNAIHNRNRDRDRYVKLKNQYRSQSNQLRIKQQQLKQKLITNIQKTFSYNLPAIQRNIQFNQSQLKKWKGDIQQLKSLKVANKTKNLKNDYKLEKELLLHPNEILKGKL